MIKYIKGIIKQSFDNFKNKIEEYKLHKKLNEDLIDCNKIYSKRMLEDHILEYEENDKAYNDMEIY